MDLKNKHMIIIYERRIDRYLQISGRFFYDRSYVRTNNFIAVGLLVIRAYRGIAVLLLFHYKKKYIKGFKQGPGNNLILK